MSKYFVGLDLGQMSDPTALCVLEKVWPPDPHAAERMSEGEQINRALNDEVIPPQPPKRPPAHFNCPHLHRYPLGTPYPDIVQAVVTLLDTPPLKGESKLVVDATGVGKPVVDLFRESSVYPVAVVITGGHTVNVDKGLHHVPKRLLVSTLKVLTGCGRLHVAPGPHRDALQKEMGNFQLTVTESRNDTYEGRSGSHDDLILSIALAAWYGERCGAPPMRRRSFVAESPFGPW